MSGIEIDCESRSLSSTVQLESEAVCWAVHAVSASIEDMRREHRGLDIFVAQQLLDRPNIRAILQEVGSKGVAERITACRFGDSCFMSG